MAFPPISPAVLAKNKDFAKLIVELKESYLNEKVCSSRAHDAEYAAVERELGRLRRDVVRERILTAALELVSYRSVTAHERSGGRGSGLTEMEGHEMVAETSQSGSLRGSLREIESKDEVGQAIQTVTCLMRAETERGDCTRVSRSDYNLLKPEMEVFRAHIPAIATAVGEVIVQWRDSARNVADLGVSGINPHLITSGFEKATNAHNNTLSPPEQPRPGKGLPQSHHETGPLTQSLLTLQTHHAHLTQTLHESQESLITTHTTLLLLHSDLLGRKIRDMELYQHGTRARYLNGRAGFLAGVARGMELKARVLELEVLRDVGVGNSGSGKGGNGGSGVRNGVRRRLEQGRDETEGLERRKAELVGLWREYEECGVGVAGGRKGEGLEVLKVLGRRYGEVESEMEVVKGDLKRLTHETREIGKNDG